MFSGALLGAGAHWAAFLGMLGALFMGSPGSQVGINSALKHRGGLLMALWPFRNDEPLCLKAGLDHELAVVPLKLCPLLYMLNPMTL